MDPNNNQQAEDAEAPGTQYSSGVPPLSGASQQASKSDQK